MDEANYLMADDHDDLRSASAFQRGDMLTITPLGRPDEQDTAVVKAADPWGIEVRFAGEAFNRDLAPDGELWRSNIGLLYTVRKAGE